MAWNNAGSIAAVNGNANFVGTSTLFLGAFDGDALVYQIGTTFWLSEISGAPADNTHLSTADNWPFSSGTIANGDWSILPCSPLRQTVATTNNQLATIIANYGSVLSLTASDNTATLNKAASTNIAGVYLTTGGAAVARMGTFGDNSLRLSMSNGGGGYNDALIADPASFLCTVFGDPTAALGIATKQYVDGSGNAKLVRAASITNISISTPGTSIGGVTPANGERYLLAGETTASTNGIYIYNGASVSMTRAPDAASAANLQPGCLVVVSEGTFANKAFILATAAPLVIGTTNLTFSQLSTSFFASPTFTGTMTMPDSATWASTGIANLVKLGIGMSPTNIVDITDSVNGVAQINVLNNNAGTSARMRVSLSNGTGSGDLFHFGASWTTSGVNRQDGTLLAGNGAGGLTIGTGLAQPIYLIINNAEVTRIDTNGRILINQTSQVNGTGRISATFNGGTEEALNLTDSAPASTNAYIRFFGSSTLIGSIANGGSTNVVYNTTSDERLKCDWRELTANEVRSKITSFYVGEHSWISNKSAPRVVNFKAQQGHPVHPQAFVPGRKKDDIWMRSVGEMEPLLTLAAQDLYKVADDHEARITALAEQVAELTKKAA